MHGRQTQWNIICMQDFIKKKKEKRKKKICMQREVYKLGRWLGKAMFMIIKHTWGISNKEMKIYSERVAVQKNFYRH